MAKRKGLAESKPGSVDELLALRRMLVAQMEMASPREASPIAGKIVDLGTRIVALRSEAVKDRGPVADEPLDASSV
jgi:hypothetical protein